MIEPILALPMQTHAWLAIAIGTFVVLWGLLRILVRLHWVSLNAVYVFQLAVLILMCEGIRTRSAV